MKRRVRIWLAKRLWPAWYWLAEPMYSLPPEDECCPGCRSAPDPGPEGVCLNCKARDDEQRRQDEIYGRGYEDGYRAAENRFLRVEPA